MRVLVFVLCFVFSVGGVRAAEECGALPSLKDGNLEELLQASALSFARGKSESNVLLEALIKDSAYFKKIFPKRTQDDIGTYYFRSVCRQLAVERGSVGKLTELDKKKLGKVMQAFANPVEIRAFYSDLMSGSAAKEAQEAKKDDTSSEPKSEAGFSTTVESAKVEPTAPVSEAVVPEPKPLPKAKPNLDMGEAESAADKDAGAEKAEQPKAQAPETVTSPETATSDVDARSEVADRGVFISPDVLPGVSSPFARIEERVDEGDDGSSSLNDGSIDSGTSENANGPVSNIDVTPVGAVVSAEEERSKALPSCGELGISNRRDCADINAVLFGLQIADLKVEHPERFVQGKATQVSLVLRPRTASSNEVFNATSSTAVPTLLGVLEAKGFVILPRGVQERPWTPNSPVRWTWVVKAQDVGASPKLNFNFGAKLQLVDRPLPSLMIRSLQSDVEVTSFGFAQNLPWLRGFNPVFALLFAGGIVLLIIVAILHGLFSGRRSRRAYRTARPAGGPSDFGVPVQRQIDVQPPLPPRDPGFAHPMGVEASRGLSGVAAGSSVTGPATGPETGPAIEIVSAEVVSTPVMPEPPIVPETPEAGTVEEDRSFYGLEPAVEDGEEEARDEEPTVERKMFIVTND